MSNPFEVRATRHCATCEEPVEQGDLMFAHEDNFICENCAREMDLICDCGNYKKEQYEMCYTCRFG